MIWESNYDQYRKIYKKTEDIPSAEKDAENFKENLTKFGFTSDEIIEVAHPKKEDMNAMKSRIE